MLLLNGLAPTQYRAAVQDQVLQSQFGVVPVQVQDGQRQEVLIMPGLCETPDKDLSAEAESSSEESPCPLPTF